MATLLTYSDNNNTTCYVTMNDLYNLFNVKTD